MIRPFVRSAGTGPAVVCLHSNASTSGQWVALMERLAPRYTVIAIDAYGAGRSPPWPADSPGRFADEADLVEAALEDVPRPWRLVGHSFGAATALMLALRDPARVCAIAVYEPTLFSLLLARDPAHPGAQGIVDVARRGAERVAAGDVEGAAAGFIDYWMGEGSWSRIPQPRRAPIAASVREIGRWSNAACSEPTPLESFARIDTPTLYMVGERSPRSTRDVAALLGPVLPGARVEELAGLGHMGPVTHPDIVNERVAAFFGS